MATIEKRVSSKGEVAYRAKVRLRGSAPLSRTFERKRDAEKWARDQETDIERGNIASTEGDRTTLRSPSWRSRRRCARGELLSLTWADLDLQRRVARLRDTKNSEPRAVPLSVRAVEVLKALPRSLEGATSLFPLTQREVIGALRQACSAAGIADLKFHDLRHEAASRICDRLPMHEAMRVTGHKTPAMLMRCYHPKAEDLARKLG